MILLDDGLATGSTMRAAIGAVRRQEPREIVVAVPIGAAATCTELDMQVDSVVCPWTPADFRAVGQGYHDFSQTTDDEVRRRLASTRRTLSRSANSATIHLFVDDGAAGVAEVLPSMALS